MIYFGNVNNKLGLKNKRLDKNTADSYWFEFKRQLEYKSHWCDKEFEEVNEYNTTKTCHICGTVKKSISLAVRSWICSYCGVEHNRDISAAKNILTVETTDLFVGDF